MLAIAGRAGHAFTPHAMMQGFVCHARGVELTASGAARVHARVRSKRVHDVLLRAERGRLSIACTCPARTYGLDFCKHAWAALLEIDRQDALGDLRTTRGPLVVEVAPVAPEPSSGDSPAEPEAPPASARRPRVKKPAASAAKSTPTEKPRGPKNTPQTVKPGGGKRANTSRPTPPTPRATKRRR